MPLPAPDPHRGDERRLDPRRLDPRRLLRSPRLLLVRLAPRAHTVLSGVAALHVLLGAALPTAFLLASGRLVGSVPGALGEGLSSPAGDRLVAALVLMGVLYTAQLALLPLLTFGSNTLGRRVDRLLSERVMRAVLGARPASPTSRTRPCRTRWPRRRGSSVARRPATP